MRRARSLWLLGLAAVLALEPCSRAEAQQFGQNRVRYHKPEMRLMKTPRFDVYYSADEEQTARIAACMAERWYARLSRLLGAKLPAHQPLVLYTTESGSQETDVFSGREPSEGTHGTMEPLTHPVFLPLASSLSATDRLLGHQLVHALQLAETSFWANGAMGTLVLERMPLWFVEGMAEYLSAGSVDAHTANWLRDAVTRSTLPHINDIDKTTQIPDRWGQTLWAYVAGRWGDPVLGRILRAAARHGDVQGAFEHTLGIKIDALSNDWHASLRDAYVSAVERVGATQPEPLQGSPDRERVNVALMISPDDCGVDPDLPTAGESPSVPYHPRLALSFVTQHLIGVGLDRFGSYLGGGTSLGFSDKLGDHDVKLTLQNDGDFSDFAGLATYMNRRSGLNWGAFIGRIPFATADDTTEDVASGYQEVRYVHRQIEQHAGLVVAYPFSRGQRVEAMGGYRRVSRVRETRTWLYDSAGDLASYDSTTAPPPPALNLAEGNLAFVWDTTIRGAISPLAGRSCRFEVGAVAGSLDYRTFLADFRHYRVPVRPFIIATRMMYYGRFGPGADDIRINPLHLGYFGFVRGYDPNSIEPSECETNRPTCHIIDRISGSQLAIANAELRFPLLGRLGAPSDFGPFAFEGALFVDAGLAWKGRHIPKLVGTRHQSVSSVGAGLRANVFGLAVVEVDYVKPFDRPNKDHVWQVNLTPGL